MAEVLSGSREAQQLTRWLSPEVYAPVARRAGLAVRLRGRPEVPAHARVLAVRCTPVTDDEHEAAVVVHDGLRVRAMALRVERVGMRWRVIAAEIG